MHRQPDSRPAFHLHSSQGNLTLAELPDAPSFPKKPLFAAVGLAFGMLLGGAGALVRELLRSGFMAERQVEDNVAVPVLASLPRLAEWWGSARMQTQPLTYLERTPLSKYSEAIRRLRALLEPTPDSRPSASPVLVTSAVPGEGKTTLLLSNDEFRSAGAQEEVRRSPVRPFVARPVPIDKSAFPGRLKFCDSRWAAAADVAAGTERALRARTGRLRLVVVQVNAGDPPDQIAAEILRLFAARQAPAPCPDGTQ